MLIRRSQRLRLIPGSGLMNRTAAVLRDLRNELTRSETLNSPPTGGRSPIGTSTVEPAKPIPVEIKQPDPEPLQIVQSIVGPLLQPMAAAGLVMGTCAKMALPLFQDRLGLAPSVALVTFAAIGIMRWPLHWSLAVLVPISVAIAWVRR